MRAILLVLVLQGCFATSVATGSVNSRPGVMPMLSELPGEAEKRDAILDQANQTAGPEHRKGETKKERKAETIGATAAAILGSAFSKTQNVTLGSAITWGGGSTPRPKTKTQPDIESEGTTEKAVEIDDRSRLPWIKLK